MGLGGRREEGGVGWVGLGEGGGERVREMGVSVRVSGRFLNAGVCHPAGLPGPHRQKRGSGLKLADDPD